MNKKILISIIIIIFIIIITVIFRNQEKAEKNLVSPKVQTIQTVEPNIEPAPKFDASTDLEKELESIDPQVLDSDLNE